MSHRKYNVVYEYDDTMGGAYGNRFWTSYLSRAEFDAISLRGTGMVVIAEGVTDEKAIDLTSLTPEICRVMLVIENNFIENPNPSNDQIRFGFTNAFYAIEADRSRIELNHLQRPDATKYIDAFNQMANAEPTTRKTAAMKAIMVLPFNDFGELL